MDSSAPGSLPAWSALPVLQLPAWQAVPAPLPPIGRHDDDVEGDQRVAATAAAAA